MSTIICLNEGGRLVLGTDSRFMRGDFSGIDSDSVPKITQCGKRVFLATTGWNSCCDFQAEKARELARDTSDIRELAVALDRASRPLLQGLVSAIFENRNLHEQYVQTINGEKPLQGFILVGRSGGVLGHVYYEYWLLDGQIELKPSEYFGAARSFKATGIDEQVAQRLGQDPSIWTDDAVHAVRRFLAEAKRTNPRVGGPDQIVAIDGKKARWVSRPPKADTVGELANAVITASISITAPTINGGLINGSAIIIDSGSNRLSLSSTGFNISEVSNPGNNITMSSGGFGGNFGGSARFSLSRATGSGVLQLYNSSSVLAFEVDAGNITTPTASGGAATLPANPQGFLSVVINGVQKKIPYYN